MFYKEPPISGLCKSTVKKVKNNIHLTFSDTTSKYYNKNIKYYTWFLLEISKKFTDHAKSLLTFISVYYSKKNYLKNSFLCSACIYVVSNYNVH